MNLSLRTKLILNFIIVIAISGLISTWVGIRFIGNGVIRQAQDKVRTDLNTAREIYRENLDDIRDVIRLTAVRFFLKDGVSGPNMAALKSELNRIYRRESLDILAVTDERGIVLYRAQNPGVFGDSRMDNAVIRQALTEKQVASGTEIMPENQLQEESHSLALRARIELIQTPMARPGNTAQVTSGMVMLAAAPVFDSRGRLSGTLYGGILLNSNYRIVDKIKETVYQKEIYKGRDIGTATIFLKDIRISTNVLKKDGTRAMGTRVSEAVYHDVLVNGRSWIQRAFVVDRWYITAYEPIRSITGQIVGMLYVGMLEDRFTDMRKETVLIFLSIAAGSILIALFVSWFLAGSIIKPVNDLVLASEKMAGGDLDHRLVPASDDEIGELARTFNRMAASLKERDERIKQFAHQKIMESERLATIGQLAAGVAHELNNPLGGILLYSHLLLENLPGNDPEKANLEKIVIQAGRCKKIVKGLLDFSRQTESEITPCNINDIVLTALSLVENQADFHNINISKELCGTLPAIAADTGQMQQVFINIILNAAEAMRGKGTLMIQSVLSGDGNHVEVRISDTGCGIDKNDIERLFEPFFTTKESGQGTGLGLAVSFGIIQKHHGTIEVQSQKNIGTTFTVRLPVTGEN